MGVETKISWCDHTFNPWRGCVKIAPECHHCYAESWARRFHPDQPLWGADAQRQIAAEAYWRNLARWDADARQAGETRLVFVASLSDFFEDRPDLIEPRQRFLDIANQTNYLRYLILTKRPENISRLWPFDEAGRPFWFGMSCGSELMARKLPVFRKAVERLQADVAFLSCEPLLFNVAPVIERNADWIDWVIAGGESGRRDRARPTPAKYFHDLRKTCTKSHIRFFFKQWGSHNSDGAFVGANPTAGGDLLGGCQYHQYPFGYRRTDKPLVWW